MFGCYHGGLDCSLGEGGLGCDLGEGGLDCGLSESGLGCGLSESSLSCGLGESGLGQLSYFCCGCGGNRKSRLVLTSRPGRGLGVSRHLVYRRCRQTTRLQRFS